MLFQSVHAGYREPLVFVVVNGCVEGVWHISKSIIARLVLFNLQFFLRQS